MDNIVHPHSAYGNVPVERYTETENVRG